MVRDECRCLRYTVDGYAMLDSIASKFLRSPKCSKRLLLAKMYAIALTPPARIVR